MGDGAGLRSSSVWRCAAGQSRGRLGVEGWLRPGIHIPTSLPGNPMVTPKPRWLPVSIC